MPATARTARTISLVMLVALLTAPVAVSVIAPADASLENKAPGAPPALADLATLDPQAFGQLADAVVDRLTVRARARRLLGSAGLAIGTSTSPDVFLTTDGTLLLSEDFINGCGPDIAAETSIQLEELNAASATPLHIVVVPDKQFLWRDALDRRGRAASTCATTQRAAWRTAMTARPGTLSLDLWSMLDERADGGRSIYYPDDSHWTFDAGSAFAGRLMEQLLPGAWDAELLADSGRDLVVRGDIAARLGLSRPVQQDVPVSVRPGHTFSDQPVDVGGTRPVRIYRSAGPGVVPGRTVVLHDSSMNYAELQLAPYFSHVEFIHYDDQARAQSLARIAEADRVIMVMVERNLRGRSRVLRDPAARAELAAALEGDPSAADRLAGELSVMRDALRDTAAEGTPTIETVLQRVPSSTDGPQVDGRHPRYGEWSLSEPTARSSEGLTPCTLPADGCGRWLLLRGVPDDLLEQLDRELDGGDGPAAGDVRVSDPHRIMYMWGGD